MSSRVEATRSTTVMTASRSQEDSPLRLTKDHRVGSLARFVKLLTLSHKADRDAIADRERM